MFSQRFWATRLHRRARAVALVTLAALCSAWPLASAQGQAQGLTPNTPQASLNITRAPSVVSRVAPVYPKAAQAAHLEADVTLQIELSAQGQVTGVTVLKPAGQGFDEAAVEALKQFVFTPAEINGEPSAVQINYVLHFASTPVEAPGEAPGAISAQTHTQPAVPLAPVSLRGRVLERATRVPIVGAAVQVTVDKTKLEPVITDLKGQFESRAPVGQATVQVLDIAHQPYQTSEILTANEQVDVTYYMMPKTFGQFETVVRGQREKKEVSRYTLHREELQSVAGSFGDPLRVVLNLPGLARTPYSTGGLIIRGAAASDTGIYFDGVQLPLIFHFAAGPSVINSEFLDRIDFYPSGFGARYGRAIGGTLDVDSRAGKSDALHGSAKIDLIDTGIYVSSPINEELGLSLAMRRSYIDAVLALVLSQTNKSLTISPVYYDYQARFDYRPKSLPGHKFKLFLMGSDDKLDVASKAQTGPSFALNNHQGFQRLMAEWLYHQDTVNLKTMAFFGFDQTSVGVGVSQVDSPAAVTGLRQDTEIKLHTNLTLRAGLDWQLRQQHLDLSIAAPLTYQAFPGALASVPLQTLKTNVSQYDFGEWLELEGKTSFWLRLIPSFRLDLFSAYSKTEVLPQPRFMLRQEIHPFSQPTLLKGSLGWYSGFSPPQTTNPAFGNPNLPAQKALQLSVGLSQALGRSLTAELTGFWSKRKNLAVPTSQVLTAANGALKPENYTANGLGNAYGLEVFVRQELSQKFFGWLAYTLSWSRQQDAAKTPWYPTLYDERHILTAIGQYRFGNGWQLGGRFRVVSAAPSTPAVGATYAADTQAYTPLNGPLRSARGPIFHQLDLRVDRLWLLNTWQLGLYLDVQNIYNRKNQDYVQYDYRYKTTQTIPDIPFLPTLGVKGVF